MNFLETFPPLYTGNSPKANPSSAPGPTQNPKSPSRTPLHKEDYVAPGAQRHSKPATPENKNTTTDNKDNREFKTRIGYRYEEVVGESRRRDERNCLYTNPCQGNHFHDHQYRKQ